MSQIINRPNPTKWLQAAMKSVVSRSIRQFFKTLDDKTPVENGHTHTAWATSAQDVASGGIDTLIDVISELNSKGSNDPLAVKNADGRVKSTQSKLSVRIRNKLPFVYTLEHGGTIKVGVNGNEGLKVDQTARYPGPLYGPRESGTGGYLVWIDGSGKHKALVRPVNSMGFFAAAVNAAKTEAQQPLQVRN